MSSLVLITALTGLAAPAFSQAGYETGRRTLIHQAIDNNSRVVLRGNTRPSANAANDRGRVSDALAMDHMLLHLQRPAEAEQSLDRYLGELTDHASPNFHRWLTPAEFGERFGPSASDVTAVSDWLQAQGFTVNRVYPSNVLIDFSGTAGQVRQAFRTEIHQLNVAGESHIANMSDPEIPAALAPAIVGVVSMNNFMPHSMKRARATYTFPVGSGVRQAVVPADLATIYKLNPLYAAGVAGQGQTIAVIENTNVYDEADWTTFRKKFGLSIYKSGSFTQVHPGSCTDPEVVGGNASEAILDAEWASAAAPAAAIQLASCRDTTTTFGGLIALQNLLNGDTAPPALISISYGACEAENGAAGNAVYNNTYRQAVAEGVSIFVASGDDGAAGCDPNTASATHGIGVNAFASTPYNVAVGGTDFEDTYFGQNSVYWNSDNTPIYGSAKSYIPEIPWNSSCGSGLLASHYGYSNRFGPDGFCNSSIGKGPYLSTSAGSGGPSGCAIGRPNAYGIVSGSCAGYRKPDWQSRVVGNPADQVRDLPDVSLFAANGVWGHYFVYCDSDRAHGGTPCTGEPNTWSGAGGTSFSAPIMAGIQALVNQKTNARWGNPNPMYYRLATSSYGSSGNSACDASKGNGTDTGCIFYDVTQGDIAVSCSGTNSCYGYSTTGPGSSYGGSVTYGILSTPGGPAFGASVGWDFATGLGTVNAYNLVMNWPSQ